jgi:hypothetical protein
MGSSTAPSKFTENWVGGQGSSTPPIFPRTRLSDRHGRPARLTMTSASEAASTRRAMYSQTSRLRVPCAVIAVRPPTPFLSSSATTSFNFAPLVLKALVSQSGPLGLSALLPPANRVYPRSSSSTPPKLISENSIPPHLPLGKDWQTIDFSLGAVLGSGTWGSGISIREFSQRLLERYRYVIGASSPLLSRLVVN